MDVDSDDGNSQPATLNHTLETVQQQEELALNVVATWLLKVSGKSRIRDIDPWEGFIAPYELARTERSSHIHSANVQLSTLRRQPCPSTICIGTCKSTVVNRLKKNNTIVYDYTQVYPFNFVLKRWTNQLGLDVGCAMYNQPKYISTLSDEVMKNIPGAVPGTFVMLPNNSTQDTVEQKKNGSAARGVALANRDFGVVNERFLRAFGCIKEEHLTRGCVEIAEEVAEEADLPLVFSGLRWRVKTFGHRLFVDETDNDNNAEDNGDEAAMDTDNDMDSIFEGKFFLVPCTSLVAWPYDGKDEEERARFGVYAVQIRARNKKTGEVFNPYWLVDGPSFKLMLIHCSYSLIENVQPINLKDWGLRIFPFKDATTWDNPTCYEGLSPLASEEEKAAFLSKKRRFAVKFQTGYVVFPRGASDHPKLAPILPPDWYNFKQFQRSGLTSVTVNEEQRVK